MQSHAVVSLRLDRVFIARLMAETRSISQQKPHKRPSFHRLFGEIRGTSLSWSVGKVFASFGFREQSHRGQSRFFPFANQTCALAESAAWATRPPTAPSECSHLIRQGQACPAPLPWSTQSNRRDPTKPTRRHPPQRRAPQSRNDRSPHRLQHRPPRPRSVRSRPQPFPSAPRF